MPLLEGLFQVVHIREARTILLFSMLATLLMGLALVVAGCVLVYLGATGHSEITLFGNQVSTGSVGVVGIFCGAVLGIMNTRRLLKALERLAALPDSPQITVQGLERRTPLPDSSKESAP